MSRCDEVRELLWPLDRPREVVEGEAEARAHLEDCPDCRAFFDREAALDHLLEHVGSTESAPKDLRVRVVAALDREPENGVQGSDPIPGSPGFSRFRRFVPWVAVAAAVALAAIGTLRTGGSSQDLTYVQAYLNRDAEPAFLATSDPAAASRFFVEEFGQDVVPVTLDRGSLERAVVCEVGGARSAMVQYQLEGHDVAHYRVPATRDAREKPLHSATEDGVCVVRWSDGEFDHALVADIPEDELRMIAEHQFAAALP